MLYLLFYRHVGLLQQIEFRALLAAFLAFAFVLLLGKPVIRWLLRQKIGDSGISDAAALASFSTSKANVPTMGGVLIVGAITASTLLLADLTEFYVTAGLLVMLVLAGLGAADDWLKLTAKRRGTGSRQGLYAWEKLVFQLALGLLVGFFLFRQGEGGEDIRHVLNLPFQRTYEGLDKSLNSSLIYLGVLPFAILAMLMIAGLSNAANITDGMDGLAGGISAAIAFGMFILCLIAGDQGMAQHLLVPYIPGAGELAVLLGAVAGACVGFLWWNCSPAQVFMGDTGSLALGGTIGYAAIVTRQEVLALVMCGIFLLEIGSVVIQVGYFKFSGGKRVFRCAPYHHHLHLGGWTEQQVVARFWIITIILIVLALASIKVR